jgi:hypothetical protein
VAEFPEDVEAIECARSYLRRYMAGQRPDEVPERELLFVAGTLLDAFSIELPANDNGAPTAQQEPALADRMLRQLVADSLAAPLRPVVIRVVPVLMPSLRLAMVGV